MRYFSIILFFFFIKMAYAQNNLYEIEYVFIVNNENTIQGIDKLFYDLSKSKAFYKNGKSEIIKDNSQSNNGGIVIDVILKNNNPEFIYFDFKKNILYNQITPLENTYITTESIPEFDWKISEEVKTVNQIELTKATTTFRGRNYEVWFSNEHPISIGPWKFSGLPGLIFEVVELADTNNYSWKLKSLKTKKGILPFNYPLDRNVINIKDYKKKILEEYIDYDNILSSKIDIDISSSSKEEVINDFENFQQQHIEKKYEWEE